MIRPVFPDGNLINSTIEINTEHSALNRELPIAGDFTENQPVSNNVTFRMPALPTPEMEYEPEMRDALFQKKQEAMRRRFPDIVNPLISFHPKFAISHLEAEEHENQNYTSYKRIKTEEPEGAPQFPFGINPNDPSIQNLQEAIAQSDENSRDFFLFKWFRWLFQGGTLSAPAAEEQGERKAGEPAEGKERELLFDAHRPAPAVTPFSGSELVAAIHDYTAQVIGLAENKFNTDFEPRMTELEKLATLLRQDHYSLKEYIERVLRQQATLEQSTKENLDAKSGEIKKLEDLISSVLQTVNPQALKDIESKQQATFQMLRFLQERNQADDLILYLAQDFCSQEGEEESIDEYIERNNFRFLDTDANYDQYKIAQFKKHVGNEFVRQFLSKGGDLTSYQLRNLTESDFHSNLSDKIVSELKERFDSLFTEKMQTFITEKIEPFLKIRIPEKDEIEEEEEEEEPFAEPARHLPERLFFASSDEIETYISNHYVLFSSRELQSIIDSIEKTREDIINQVRTDERILNLQNLYEVNQRQIEGIEGIAQESMNKALEIERLFEEKRNDFQSLQDQTVQSLNGLQDLIFSLQQSINEQKSKSNETSSPLLYANEKQNSKEYTFNNDATYETSYGLQEYFTQNNLNQEQRKKITSEIQLSFEQQKQISLDPSIQEKQAFLSFLQKERSKPSTSRKYFILSHLIQIWKNEIDKRRLELSSGFSAIPNDLTEAIDRLTQTSIDLFYKFLGQSPSEEITNGEAAFQYALQNVTDDTTAAALYEINYNFNPHYQAIENLESQFKEIRVSVQNQVNETLAQLICSFQSKFKEQMKIVSETLSNLESNETINNFLSGAISQLESQGNLNLESMLKEMKQYQIQQSQAYDSFIEEATSSITKNQEGIKKYNDLISNFVQTVDSKLGNLETRIKEMQMSVSHNEEINQLKMQGLHNQLNLANEFSKQLKEDLSASQSSMKSLVSAQVFDLSIRTVEQQIQTIPEIAREKAYEGVDEIISDHMTSIKDRIERLEQDKEQKQQAPKLYSPQIQKLQEQNASLQQKITSLIQDISSSQQQAVEQTLRKSVSDAQSPSRSLFLTPNRKQQQEVRDEIPDNSYLSLSNQKEFHAQIQQYSPPNSSLFSSTEEETETETPPFPKSSADFQSTTQPLIIPQMRAGLMTSEMLRTSPQQIRIAAPVGDEDYGYSSGTFIPQAGQVVRPQATDETRHQYLMSNPSFMEQLVNQTRAFEQTVFSDDENQFSFLGVAFPTSTNPIYNSENIRGIYQETGTDNYYITLADRNSLEPFSNDHAQFYSNNGAILPLQDYADNNPDLLSHSRIMSVASPSRLDSSTLTRTSTEEKKEEMPVKTPAESNYETALVSLESVWSIPIVLQRDTKLSLANITSLMTPFFHLFMTSSSDEHQRNAAEIMRDMISTSENISKRMGIDETSLKEALIKIQQIFEYTLGPNVQLHKAFLASNPQVLPTEASLRHCISQFLKANKEAIENGNFSSLAGNEVSVKNPLFFAKPDRQDEFYSAQQRKQISDFIYSEFQVPQKLKQTFEKPDSANIPNIMNFLLKRRNQFFVPSKIELRTITDNLLATQNIPLRLKRKIALLIGNPIESSYVAPKDNRDYSKTLEDSQQLNFANFKAFLEDVKGYNGEARENEMKKLFFAANYPDVNKMVEKETAFETYLKSEHRRDSSLGTSHLAWTKYQKESVGFSGDVEELITSYPWVKDEMFIAKINPRKKTQYLQSAIEINSASSSTDLSSTSFAAVQDILDEHIQKTEGVEYQKIMKNAAKKLNIHPVNEKIAEEILDRDEVNKYIVKNFPGFRRQFDIDEMQGRAQNLRMRLAYKTLHEISFIMQERKTQDDVDIVEKFILENLCKESVDPNELIKVLLDSSSFKDKNQKEIAKQFAAYVTVIFDLYTSSNLLQFIENTPIITETFLANKEILSSGPDWTLDQFQVRAIEQARNDTNQHISDLLTNNQRLRIEETDKRKQGQVIALAWKSDLTKLFEKLKLTDIAPDSILESFIKGEGVGMKRQRKNKIRLDSVDPSFHPFSINQEWNFSNFKSVILKMKKHFFLSRAPIENSKILKLQQIISNVTLPPFFDKFEERLKMYAALFAFNVLSICNQEDQAKLLGNKTCTSPTEMFILLHDPDFRQTPFFRHSISDFFKSITIAKLIDLMSTFA